MINRSEIFVFSAPIVDEPLNSAVSVLFFSIFNQKVIWSAPFLSGGGYCSEALSLVKAIDRRGFDVHIQQVLLILKHYQ